MKIHGFHGTIPPEMTPALVEFEREFTYPLGESCRFRISHGDDYLAFFRAMGHAELLVAGNHGMVQGTITRVLRSVTVRSSAGSVEKQAHYLCDLKVREACRGGSVLARLFARLKKDIEAGPSHSCFCVVMEGTGRLPTDYTGRIGVPGFERLGEIMILRLSSAGETAAQGRSVDKAEFNEVNRGIPTPGIRPASGVSKLRSVMVPEFLLSLDGDACGVLEDTRKGKRLFLDSGEEMPSAHLSDFRFRSVYSAARLLEYAVKIAKGRGIPAVFVAVPASQSPALLPALSHLEVTTAPAMIYGHDIEADADWWINTAEV